MQKATFALGLIAISESNWENLEFISLTSTDGVIWELSLGSLLSNPFMELYVWNSFWTVVGILLKEVSYEKTYKFSL